jgi:hypothetical protein
MRGGCLNEQRSPLACGIRRICLPHSRREREGGTSLALESDPLRRVYRRRLRGRVIHVCWHFRQRNSISSFVASTSSNRFEPHCGQGSARDRSRSGRSGLARVRRLPSCRRPALPLSRELFIGYECECEAHALGCSRPPAPQARTDLCDVSGVSQTWLSSRTVKRWVLVESRTCSGS